MIGFRVRDWDKHFENNRTREMKNVSWVPFPIKHDGDGYTELLDHPNGPSHLAAWVVMVQVAAKCDPRGTLLRDTGKPHDARSLGRMTRLPAAVINEAIPRLIAIGWLEAVWFEWVTETTDDESTCTYLRVTAVDYDSPPREGAVIPQEGAPAPQAAAKNRTEQNRIEGNGTEGGGGEACAPSPPAMTAWTFPIVSPASEPREWTLPQAVYDTLVATYTAVNVDLELGKARAWAVTNPTLRKTAGGMAKFLNRWMSKEQDRAGTAQRQRFLDRTAANQSAVQDAIASLQLEDATV